MADSLSGTRQASEKLEERGERSNVLARYRLHLISVS
jgi:hypothetical protein